MNRVCSMGDRHQMPKVIEWTKDARDGWDEIYSTAWNVIDHFFDDRTQPGECISDLVDHASRLLDCADLAVQSKIFGSVIGRPARIATCGDLAQWCRFQQQMVFAWRDVLKSQPGPVWVFDRASSKVIQANKVISIMSPLYVTPPAANWRRWFVALRWYSIRDIDKKALSRALYPVMPKMRLVRVAWKFMRDLEGTHRPVEPESVRSAYDVQRELDKVILWCDQQAERTEPKRVQIAAKNDTDQKKPLRMPDNVDVRDLCALLAKSRKTIASGKKSELGVARDFTKEKQGNDTKAKNLLRQARRYAHLWKR